MKPAKQIKIFTEPMVLFLQPDTEHSARMAAFNRLEASEQSAIRQCLTKPCIIYLTETCRLDFTDGLFTAIQTRLERLFRTGDLEQAAALHTRAYFHAAAATRSNPDNFSSFEQNTADIDTLLKYLLKRLIQDSKTENIKQLTPLIDELMHTMTLKESPTYKYELLQISLVMAAKNPHIKGVRKEGTRLSRAITAVLKDVFFYDYDSNTQLDNTEPRFGKPFLLARLEAAGNHKHYFYVYGRNHLLECRDLIPRAREDVLTIINYFRPRLDKAAPRPGIPLGCFAELNDLTEDVEHNARLLSYANSERLAALIEVLDRSPELKKGTLFSLLDTFRLNDTGNISSARRVLCNYLYAYFTPLSPELFRLVAREKLTGVRLTLFNHAVIVADCNLANSLYDAWPPEDKINEIRKEYAPYQRLTALRLMLGEDIHTEISAEGIMWFLANSPAHLQMPRAIALLTTIHQKNLHAIAAAFFITPTLPANLQSLIKAFNYSPAATLQAAAHASDQESRPIEASDYEHFSVFLDSTQTSAARMNAFQQVAPVMQVALRADIIGSATTLALWQPGKLHLKISATEVYLNALIKRHLEQGNYAVAATWFKAWVDSGRPISKEERPHCEWNSLISTLISELVYCGSDRGKETLKIIQQITWFDITARCYTGEVPAALNYAELHASLKYLLREAYQAIGTQYTRFDSRLARKIADLLAMYFPDVTPGEPAFFSVHHLSLMSSVTRLKTADPSLLENTAHCLDHDELLGSSRQDMFCRSGKIADGIVNRLSDATFLSTLYTRFNLTPLAVSPIKQPLSVSLELINQIFESLHSTELDTALALLDAEHEGGVLTHTLNPRILKKMLLDFYFPAYARNHHSSKNLNLAVPLTSDIDYHRLLWLYESDQQLSVYSHDSDNTEKLKHLLLRELIQAEVIPAKAGLTLAPNFKAAGRHFYDYKGQRDEYDLCKADPDFVELWCLMIVAAKLQVEGGESFIDYPQFARYGDAQFSSSFSVRLATALKHYIAINDWTKVSDSQKLSLLQRLGEWGFFRTFHATAYPIYLSSVTHLLTTLNEPTLITAAIDDCLHRCLPHYLPEFCEIIRRSIAEKLPEKTQLDKFIAQNAVYHINTYLDALISPKVSFATLATHFVSALHSYKGITHPSLVIDLLARLLAIDATPSTTQHKKIALLEVALRTCNSIYEKDKKEVSTLAKALLDFALNHTTLESNPALLCRYPAITFKSPEAKPLHPQFLQALQQADLLGHLTPTEEDLATYRAKAKAARGDLRDFATFKAAAEAASVGQSSVFKMKGRKQP